MSGTSLDGVDAVLADFSSKPPVVLASAHQPFPVALRAELLALQSPGPDEIARAAVAGNGLSIIYAAAVEEVLQTSSTDKKLIRAVGCHGQTVRHRPGSGFTCQIGNPGFARRAQRHPHRVRFPFARYRCGGSRRAACTGVPRRGLLRSHRKARDPQYRWHREPHRTRHRRQRDGLRLRPRKRANGSVVGSAPGNAV
jgi:hypothetical protein